MLLSRKVLTHSPVSDASLDYILYIPYDHKSELNAVVDKIKKLLCSYGFDEMIKGTTGIVYQVHFTRKKQKATGSAVNLAVLTYHLHHKRGKVYYVINLYFPEKSVYLDETDKNLLRYLDDLFGNPVEVVVHGIRKDIQEF